jgi:hypothetical protein
VFMGLAIHRQVSVKLNLQKSDFGWVHSTKTSRCSLCLGIKFENVFSQCILWQTLGEYRKSWKTRLKRPNRRSWPYNET